MDMYDKKKIAYFICFIATATQYYSPKYELKYQLLCNKNKNIFSFESSLLT